MAAVNRPTDVKVKEKDINQKLQLYGIYNAFARGKVPSNKQIDVALNSALSSPALAKPSPKLSEEGRKLVADLQEVIKQAKVLLLTKNEGNLLQDFIWQTEHLSAGDARLPGAPTDKQTAQQHGNQVLEGLRTLGTLLISNGQFRKLLNDLSILIRDMAGDAAQNAANRVNPNEDQLAQLDEAAEDNTWHDVPDLSRDNLRNQAKSTYNKQKPFTKGDVDQAANNAANAADRNQTGDGEYNQQSGQAGAQAAGGTLREQASANIPEDTKKKGNQVAKSAKNYLGDKLPKERREQTIWRLKKMLTEIQGHSDYQQAIETLLDLAETYGRHGRDMSQAGAGTVKGAHADDSLQAAETDLKTLIERFANCTSTEDLFDSIRNVYADADRDPELKNWFKSVDRFIRKCLKEQGYILQDQSNEEWNQLYDKGNYLLRERYRDHTDRIIDETKFLADQFDKDPQNKAFGQAMQKLFQDLGNDENGKPVFKKHLLTDVSNVIVPAIFEHTRYVPIPRIEVSDPMIDAVVENLVIESDNLAPNVIEFGSDNYFRWGRKKISNKHDNKIMISASGVQMDLKDVSYYIKKKQGFPSITDTGVMDIYLGGEGFSFKIAASNAHKTDRQHFAKIDKVTVDVKNLKIKIKQSNHKLLFSIAKPILLKVMRPVIQKVLEKQIRDSFTQADAYAYGIHQEAQGAVERAKANPDPENVSNIYKEYVSAIQRKMTAKKEKAQDKASNTKVNMAVTQHDSIFKEIRLPGGISTKATEFKDLAAKGDKWESPVFGIGSARETTDLPKLQPVSRKPHNAVSGSVRGRDVSSSGGNLQGTNSAAHGYNQGANSASQGYSQGAGAGAGQVGSPGYASTNGAPPSGGFSTQVDQAFGMKNTQASSPHSGIHSAVTAGP